MRARTPERTNSKRSAITINARRFRLAMKLRHLLTVPLLAFPILANAADAVGPTGHGRPYNLSARAEVRTGESVLIGGFIVGGSVPKRVLLRAIGPSLATNGVGFPGRLMDPTLTLFRQGTSAPVAMNDNWKDTQQASIQASGLAPGSDFDSAIDATLDPGNYTIVLSGKNQARGTGLVEVYEARTGVTAAPQE